MSNGGNQNNDEPTPEDNAALADMADREEAAMVEAGIIPPNIVDDIADVLFGE